MSNLIRASELLDYEVQSASDQLNAEPGNILLAMRLARIQVIASLCKTYGVAADIASGYIPVTFEPGTGMDERSNSGDELAGSGCSVTITDACAPKCGQHADQDELSSRRKQLSLELGGD